MKETDRIIKLIEDLYNGSPWIDVNITGILGNITTEQAAKKITPNHNSIWEIVNHLISWRIDVLKRVKDEVTVTPDHNYFQPVNDVSTPAWNDTLKRLKDSQQQWIDFLKTFNENDFAKVYLNNNMTYYEHIHGIIQHDAYHLGQISLLAKLVHD